MRILMVSDVYFPRVNGVSTSIQTLRQALAEAGHTSVLVAPEYPATMAEAGIVRVPGWPIPRDPEDRLMHPRALAAALDALDPADFDLVHIHTPFLAHRAGVRWARRHGLPCVETYHTLFEEYFHHYLPFLPKSWLAAAARMISRKECDGVTAVIAPSSAMKQALQAYGVSSPIHIIPTGLRQADFSNCDGPAFRARHGIPAARPVMAYVGRVERVERSRQRARIHQPVFGVARNLPARHPHDIGLELRGRVVRHDQHARVTRPGQRLPQRLD